MVMAKTITGKLPGEKFLKAFDFTVPEKFYPLKEDVEEETAGIEEDIADTIRKHVNRWFAKE